MEKELSVNDAIIDFFKDKIREKAKFKIYKNPMRDDLVFIGEAKEIQPYKEVTGAHGENLYPAVPQGALIYPVGISKKVANVVIDILNERI